MSGSRLTAGQRRRLQQQLQQTPDARVYRRTLALLDADRGRQVGRPLKVQLSGHNARRVVLDCYFASMKVPHQTAPVFASNTAGSAESCKNITCGGNESNIAELLEP
jgi:hypothetical protein